jgi:SAM-dependent methyltransferase
MMTLPDIDWNEVWRTLQAEKHAIRRDPKFWNKRAPEFTRRAEASGYVGRFMAIMDPQPDWTVLDVGCAAGTLAVPLAPVVNRITAMDPSDAMLALLEKRRQNLGFTNIDVVKGRWEDDWEALGIGVHDVAVASRSLVVEDLREAIVKLQRYAAKRVYISTLVDDGPRDRRIVEAAGRPFYPGADYIVVYNLIRQMGIHADVAFICKSKDKTYSDVEDALNSMRWMVHDMTAEEETRLRTYLCKNLVRENGRWKMPGRRTVRWAVIWWDNDCSVEEAIGGNHVARETACTGRNLNGVDESKAIRIVGRVKKPLVVHAKELGAMASEELDDFPVYCGTGDPKGSIGGCRGVLLENVISMAEIIKAEHNDTKKMFVVVSGDDGYKAVFSWQEIFNTPIGGGVMILIEKNGRSLCEKDGDLELVSAEDYFTGPRYVRKLRKIEVLLA